MSELKHGVSRRSIASWLGVASTAALVGCAARAEGEPTAVATAADTVAGALTTIADLRDHAPLATESYAIVQGYYRAGDGGGGVFWWNPSTTAADNGGTVIAVAGVATGRWCRALGEPGVLDLAWFGARASAGSGAVNKAALINALTVIAGWGRGTLQLALLYPLGDDSDASWLGVGVGVASADGGALTAPVHHLTIAATVDGAGFQFARATAAHTNAGLKFAGCTGLTLRGLTLDGGGQGLELVYLLGCRGATIERCTFQNAITSFSLETTGGVDARIEGNHFAAGGGAKIGYISTVGAHEEGAHVVGNRFVTTGEMPGNRRAAIYAAIRNGVIANNSFEAAAAGVILLSDGLASEVCHALTVTGNCFLGCDFGVRGDPTTSQGPAQPLTAIAITGNVIENAGGASHAPAIGIFIANDVVVTGNVLRDCDSAYAIDLRSIVGGVVADNIVELSKPSTLVAPAAAVGILYSVEATETRDLVIRGNVIDGYAAGILGGSNGATVSNVTIADNAVTRLTGAATTIGIRVDPATVDAAVLDNRVDASATFAYALFSTARVQGNAGAVTTFGGATYFAESEGRRTFAPAASPPSAPPAGITFAIGDLTYNAAPATAAPLGWVWAGSARGWRPFGTIG